MAAATTVISLTSVVALLCTPVCGDRINDRSFIFQTLHGGVNKQLHGISRIVPEKDDQAHVEQNGKTFYEGDVIYSGNRTPSSAICDSRDVLQNRHVAFIVLFSTILCVGVAGNSVAIAVIVLSKKLRRQPTNIIIVSLSLADLGALLCVTTLRIDIERHNG